MKRVEIYLWVQVGIKLAKLFIFELEELTIGRSNVLETGKGQTQCIQYVYILFTRSDSGIVKERNTLAHAENVDMSESDRFGRCHAQQDIRRWMAKIAHFSMYDFSMISG